MSQKKHYPESNKIGKLYTDGLFTYEKDTIQEHHIQYANNDKIFILLCRRASADLGSDYDDKSLIHAIPKSDNPKMPRIFMAGRFGVKNNQTTQP